ncbi:hypothetical protein Mapa_009023 [Marchantia paleacea]|nr:hypothetical protein Mapa_009023 [Marchantia paleacea]
MAALTQLCCSSILCSSAPSSSSIAAIRSVSSSCSHSRDLGLHYSSLRSSSRPHVAPLACELARPWECRIGGRTSHLRAGRGAAVVCVQQEQQQQQQQLPAKLQEIVKLFEAVPDSKQKYEQLLYYAKQLKPLAKEFCTKENKMLEAAKAGSGNGVRQVSSQASAPVSTNAQVAQQMDSGKSFSPSAAPEQLSKKDSIQKKLQEALAPTLLEVDDVSHQHAGHAGVHKGATETHFNVKVVSDKFAGTSLIKRHRLVYELLDEEIKNGVHALSLVTKTPTEIGK